LIPIGYLVDVTALATLTFFIVFPALGCIIGQDQTATEPAPEISRLELAYYKALPLIYVPILYACLGYGAYVVTTKPMLAWSTGAMVLSLYVVAACGTAVAHELMHHRAWIDKSAARLLWGLTGYGWYQSEHWTHHTHAGDVQIGSTPYAGESVYQFAWRNTIQGLRNALQWERRFAFRTKYLRENGALTVALFLGMLWAFGWKGGLLYAGLVVFCIFVVQAITYIQHYGLESQHRGPGAMQLAWRDNCFVGNAMSLNINHHSHHHDAPSLPYYRLMTDASAPKLPASYALMFIIALIPAAWRRIIDPRLARFHRQVELRQPCDADTPSGPLRLDVPNGYGR
jgi:alkane 1-monooxygenase